MKSYSKLKVLTVVGTRPEIIRLSEVIKRFDQESCFEHILVHTGQNYDYELNDVFFRDSRTERGGRERQTHYCNRHGQDYDSGLHSIVIQDLLEKEGQDEHHTGKRQSLEAVDCGAQHATHALED